MYPRVCQNVCHSTLFKAPLYKSLATELEDYNVLRNYTFLHEDRCTWVV